MKDAVCLPGSSTTRYTKHQSWMPIVPIILMQFLPANGGEHNYNLICLSQRDHVLAGLLLSNNYKCASFNKL